jgi:hypothetical protein
MLEGLDEGFIIISIVGISGEGCVKILKYL